MILYFAYVDGDECIVAHNQETGICTNIKKCPQVVEMAHKGIRYKVCSYSGGAQFVCCSIASNQEPSRPSARISAQSKSGMSWIFHIETSFFRLY